MGKIAALFFSEPVARGTQSGARQPTTERAAQTGDPYNTLLLAWEVIDDGLADGGEIARLIGTDVRDLMVAAIEHRFGMVFVRSKMPWVSISGDTTKREEMG